MTVETTDTLPDSPAETPSAPGEGTDIGQQNQGLIEALDRYRTERDGAREELAAANTRIERMQRAEVERLAADGLSHPADVFSLSGNDLADYLTDDGDVDAARVAADVAEILAERPGLRKRAPAFDPTIGTGGRGP